MHPLVLLQTSAVYVMGGVMAATTLPDLFHDMGRMRGTMAVLAMGYGLVLLRMAQGACKVRVFAPTVAENVCNLFVTGSAVSGWHIEGVADNGGRVCSVTLTTSIRWHFG
jgi:hypothetical protein